jgi:hypothetical protein
MVMSAFPPKADMCSALAHVCFGPRADIARSYSITSSAEVLPAAKLAVWSAQRCNCSFFGDLRDQLQVRFGHRFSPSAFINCS